MSCTCSYEKSMLSAYTNSSTALAVDDLLPYKTINIKRGISISLTPGSTTINLVRAGRYSVTIDATVSTPDAAGVVTIELYRNNIAVPGATASETTTTTTDIHSLHFTTLIEVDDVCRYAGTGVSVIPLTIKNTGVAATYTNINITIVRLA